MKNRLAPFVALALLLSVVAANWVTAHYGLVPAGFGLLVTAGTYFAGVSLGLRDLLQQVGGIRWAIAAVAAGIVVSFAMGTGRIALASAVAFGLGEMADLFIYTPIRKRDWRPAVVVGNAVGAVVDTVVFLSIAGFPLTGQSVGGQLLVKAVWMTLLALIVGELIARTIGQQKHCGATRSSADPTRMPAMTCTQKRHDGQHHDARFGVTW